jgi:transposase InsO family protein
MRSSRFAHLSPKQLVPQLADQGLYLGSESTFYRLQRRYELRTIKRAMSRTDVTRAATVHHATGPNQVWSWDITWLPTTVRGIYLHLYLVMDVWSRRIVGWRIADGDSAQIAAELITQTCREGNLDPRGLVLHSDNGNHQHRHSAIRYVTPDERHSGREREILARRHQLYQRVHDLNPERWTRSTRNWRPVGSVVRNPTGGSDAAAS